MLLDPIQFKLKSKRTKGICKALLYPTDRIVRLMLKCSLGVCNRKYVKSEVENNNSCVTHEEKDLRAKYILQIYQ
jgi:hypothetical protein